MEEYKKLPEPQKKRIEDLIKKVLNDTSSAILNNQYDENIETVRTFDDFKERILSSFSQPGIDIHIDNISYTKMIDDYLPEKTKLLEYLKLKNYFFLPFKDKIKIKKEFRDVLIDLGLTKCPITFSKIELYGPKVTDFLKKKINEGIYISTSKDLARLTGNINKDYNRNGLEFLTPSNPKASTSGTSDSGTSDLSKMTTSSIQPQTSALSLSSKKRSHSPNASIEPKPKGPRR